MERKEAIRGAYRMTGGNSFYDGMITCSTLSGKAVCRLVWAMNKAENDAYPEKAMFRYSGAFLRQAAGSAGGNRDSDYVGLSDYAGGGHYLSRLFARYDEAGTGKG